MTRQHALLTPNCVLTYHKSDHEALDGVVEPVGVDSSAHAGSPRPSRAARCSASAARNAYQRWSPVDGGYCAGSATRWNDPAEVAPGGGPFSASTAPLGRASGPARHWRVS